MKPHWANLQGINAGKCSLYLGPTETGLLESTITDNVCGSCIQRCSPSCSCVRGHHRSQYHACVILQCSSCAHGVMMTSVHTQPVPSACMQSMTLIYNERPCRGKGRGKALITLAMLQQKCPGLEATMRINLMTATSPWIRQPATTPPLLCKVGLVRSYCHVNNSHESCNVLRLTTCGGAARQA
jgi:hypothetical protein